MPGKRLNHQSSREPRMSEDTTRNLSPDDKLDLLLAEVSSIKTELRNLSDRVAALEAKSYDTRPIWERALAEILEVRTDVQEIKKEMRQSRRQMEVLSSNYVKVIASLDDREDSASALENKLERPPA
jgi:uncharacterized coiled-coil DUF342 family protein